MRALPNWLTVSRVVMAVVFFAILTLWRWDGSAAQTGGVDALLLACAALFAVATLTDALDGYLARRWNVESAFGRIMDPFADKVLVLGALVFLAGPDFWWRFPEGHAARLAGSGIQISGIYPWMVVAIIARELMVTSIRGVLEAQGVRFGAVWAGKLKMIFQSAGIPAILAIIALWPTAPVVSAGDPGWHATAGRIAVDVIAWTMVGVTLLSGVPYVTKGFSLLRVKDGAGAGGGAR